MALPNVFNQEVSQQIIERLQKITQDTKPLWGKMNASQMLAHCSVTYEYILEPGKYKPTPALVKFFLKLLVKNKVTNEQPYKQNSPTGPDFKIEGNKDFELEKRRLIGFIEKTQSLGSGYFEGLESHSFGKLTAIEWNNMFYKHLNHHLSQFGV